MYSVVGDWIVVVFELDSVGVVVDWILVWTGLLDGSLVLQFGGFAELSPRLLKLEPSVPNVVCVDFVHVRQIQAWKFTAVLSQLSQIVWGCLTQCF